MLYEYSNRIIEEQFNRLLLKYKTDELLDLNNYARYRQENINFLKEERILVNYKKQFVVHFTYCINMRRFLANFHILWNKYFGESPMNDATSMLGTRNVGTIQRCLGNTKSKNS